MVSDMYILPGKLYKAGNLYRHKNTLAFLYKVYSLTTIIFFDFY